MPDLALELTKLAGLNICSRYSCSNEIANSLAFVTIPTFFSLELTCRSRHMMAGLHGVSDRLQGRLTDLYLCGTFGTFGRRPAIFAGFI